mgnify:CR=1 FL=1
MGANELGGANRWRRFDDWDKRPLRLDNFAVEDPENGFSAMAGAKDPAPSLVIENGRVTSMDGTSEEAFDMIDLFIARYHLDLEVAEEAMAMPSIGVARMLVDISVPRDELVRLAHGMTPAKLAEVVAHLNAMEIAFAYSKMRARATPGNQAHVTNAKDDPLQLAADAATAEGFSVDKKQVVLASPIKYLGLHDVHVLLHPEVDVTIQMNVARSNEEAELQASGKSIQELEAEAEAEADFEIAELFDDIGAAAMDDDDHGDSQPIVDDAPADED